MRKSYLRAKAQPGTIQVSRRGKAYITRRDGALQRAPEHDGMLRPAVLTENIRRSIQHQSTPLSQPEVVAPEGRPAGVWWLPVAALTLIVVVLSFLPFVMTWGR